MAHWIAERVDGTDVTRYRATDGEAERLRERRRRKVARAAPAVDTRYTVHRRNRTEVLTGRWTFDWGGEGRAD